MPLARTYSVALVGVTGHVIEVEADIANGLVGMILVGLPDTALREARDRIRAAIVNSGEEWPQRKITVGLSPASLPKRGSWFDLAIAVGVLTAAGKVPRAALDGVMFFGELGLDGRLRPVRGVLPAVAAAADAGFVKIMVAEQNAAEAALVPGVRVIAANSLTGAADWLRGTLGLHDGALVTEFAGGQEIPRSWAGDGSASVWAQSPAIGRALAVGPAIQTLRSGPISLSCSGSPPPDGPQRYARQAVITCRCSGRQGWVRPCWQNGFPPSCPGWIPPRRWRSRPSTPWPEPSRRTFPC